MRDPVFVVGMPRSGTTLVARMLSTHSGLAISPETHYFTKHHDRFEQAGGLADRDAARDFVQYLLSTRELADFGFTEPERQQILARVSQTPRPNDATVLRNVLEAYAQKQAKPWVGEKTPEHLRHVPKLADLFPDSRFVCVIRDARDVSLSWRGVPWNRGDVLYHAWLWRRYSRLSTALAHRYPERFLEVRYEDLVQDAEPVLRELCVYLGLPFERGMLRFQASRELTFDPTREPWKARAADALDPRRAMRWRREMPREEVIVVQVVAGRELARRGYPPGEVGWDLLAHAKACWKMLQGGGEWLRDKLQARNGSRESGKAA